MCKENITIGKEEKEGVKGGGEDKGVFFNVRKLKFSIHHCLYLDQNEGRICMANPGLVLTR
jgi:hypothetical protein